MTIKLEGYIDDGHGLPLEGIAATVTTVVGGTVVETGVTGSDGRWEFAGLNEADEYFVTMADGNGNAVVRGPWSGGLREAWVRDRLALPDTAQVVLPNGGNTTVGGLPLALDPDPDNTLAWTGAGLFVPPIPPGIDAYTKAESDARFVDVTGDTMSGVLSVGSTFKIDPANATISWADMTFIYDTALTRGGSGGLTLNGSPVLTQTSGDVRYPLKTDLDPYPNYLTSTEADALFLTQAEGDARYTQGGITQAAADLRYEPLDSAYTKGEADARYVNVAGDLMSGGLMIWGAGGPTISAFQVGTTGDAVAALNIQKSGQIEWSDRSLAADTFLARTAVGVLSINSKPVAISPDGSNIIEWRANGFYAAAGAVTDIWVDTTGDTMTGLLTEHGAATSTVVHQTKLPADTQPRFTVQAGGTLAWGPGGSTATDTTMLRNAANDLRFSANVTPTTNNARDLGDATIRWRTVYLQTSAVIGPNAASAGNVRLPNNTNVAWRNGANSADLALTVNPSNELAFNGVVLGNLTQAAADTRYVNVTGDTLSGALNFDRASALPAFQTVDTGAFLFQAQFRLDVNGAHSWGDGSSATDTTLARTAVNTLGLTNRLVINPLTDPALPAGYTAQPGLLVQHEASAHINGLSLAKASSDAPAERLAFWRTRGTWASKVAIANGDYISAIEGWAWTGSQWFNASAIYTSVFGAVTTTAVPTKVDFLTADSAGTLGARMSIGPDGRVAVGGNVGAPQNCQVDVKSTSASMASLYVSAHASFPTTGGFFQALATNGTCSWGARSDGVICDRLVTAGLGTYSNTRIPVYNGAGTLIGYMPLYN